MKYSWVAQLHPSHPSCCHTICTNAAKKAIESKSTKSTKSTRKLIKKRHQGEERIPWYGKHLEGCMHRKCIGFGESLLKEHPVVGLQSCILHIPHAATQFATMTQRKPLNLDQSRRNRRWNLWRRDNNGKKENQDIDNIQKDQKKNALEKITTLG